MKRVNCLYRVSSKKQVDKISKAVWSERVGRGVADPKAREKIEEVVDKWIKR